MINRRGFLGALLVAPVAAHAPSSLFEFDVAALEASAVPMVSGAIYTYGAVPRLLQEGIHKLMSEMYANLPAEYPQIFATRAPKNG